MLDMLPPARDIAIVVLAIEGIVVLALPLLLFWQSIKALRRARPQAAVMLRQANANVARATQRVNAALLAVRRPFLWFTSAYASLASALRRAARLLGCGR